VQVGSLLGLAVALSPAPLRALVLTGPLSFVYAAAKQAGAASPPLSLISLGFALAGASGAASESAGEAPPRGGFFTNRETLAVCAARLVLLPIAHLAAARVLAGTLVPAPTSGVPPLHEPMRLVLLLQAAMPSALSVNAVFQRAAADTRPLGKLMIVQYLLAMPTIVASVVVGSVL
jgi:predicted permease